MEMKKLTFKRKGLVSEKNGGIENERIKNFISSQMGTCKGH